MIEKVVKVKLNEGKMTEIEQSIYNLKKALGRKTMIREIDKDTITIATGDTYSVKLKVLGFDK